MPTLRAEENRYLLTADRTVAGRLPGAKWNRPLGCWTMPRKPAAVYALDKLLGPQGWTPDEATALDADSARATPIGRALHNAQVELRGGRLAVECGIQDKELVKRVPGYAWSPADRRWFVDAVPLSLELLQEGFGDKLVVAPEVETLLDLRRRSERPIEGPSGTDVAHSPEPVARQRAGADELPATPPLVDAKPAGDDDHLPGAPASADNSHSDPIRSLAEQVARLADAVTRLEARLAGGEATRAPEAWAVDEVGAAAEEPEAADWDEIVRLAATDPGAALGQAEARLQTTSGEQGALRVAAGIAAARGGLEGAGDAGLLNAAHRHLRLGLGAGDTLPGELEREALDAYPNVVLALIRLRCGPEPGQSCGSIDDLQSTIVAELTEDNGFDDQALSSDDSQELLTLLTEDQALRERFPRLGELCRVLQLLATDRAHSPRASERVEELLLGQRLGEAGFALALILFANRLSEVTCLEDWRGAWPSSELRRKGVELGGLAARVPELQGLSTELRGAAALSMLGLLSAVGGEHVPFTVRRQLLTLVAKADPRRNMAEFLAVMPFAEGGDEFDRAFERGYLATIEQMPLAVSQAHLELVEVQATPGTPLLRHLAESVATAVARFGFEDPEAEGPFFLLLASNNPERGRSLLAISGALEDESLPGVRPSTSLVADIYGEAFRGLVEARRAEAVDAFLRLARFLSSEGDSSTIAVMCAEHSAGPVAPLRVAAVLTSVELMMDGGATPQEIAATIEKYRDQKKKEPLHADIAAECRCLAELFPADAECFLSLLPAAASIEEPPATFAGKRILVVGGHQQMKARGTELLKRMEIQVDWQDAAEAENGKQLLDLARGAADLVVINTAYIGHAASGRAREAADAAGKRVAFNGSGGVGSLCATVKTELDILRAQDEAKPRGKVAGLRVLARR